MLYGTITTTLIYNVPSEVCVVQFQFRINWFGPQQQRYLERRGNSAGCRYHLPCRVSGRSRFYDFLVDMVQKT
jgi:hypothetical protein